MPGLKHQSIVQILRDEPQLLVMFLGGSGFRLPSGAFPVIVDSDLSHRALASLKSCVRTMCSFSGELEQLMEDLFKDPFIDRFLEEGKQQGRADSAARVLVTILAARGIAIADQVRARIAECADPDLLERWATRAATSTTIDEVFAS
jgi:hypothetical protein